MNGDNIMNDESNKQALKNHEELVNNVREHLPEDKQVEALSDLFKVFGDATRARIMSCLEVRDLCVCDIAEILNDSISGIASITCLKNCQTCESH